MIRPELEVLDPLARSRPATTYIIMVSSSPNNVLVVAAASRATVPLAPLAREVLSDAAAACRLAQGVCT